MKKPQSRQRIQLLVAGTGLFAVVNAFAASPTCGVNETLLSWPAVNPVWEMCYLRPSLSSGPRGSGLELRNVYLNGKLALKRAHAPMLFAEYTTNTCYRDWKDTDGPKITWASVHPSFQRKTTTSCDRSKSTTTSYGVCPYQLVINGSSGDPVGTCAIGVTIEDAGSYVELTTQYDAAWYKYSSRFRFHADGSFEPEFGFGNSDGTHNGITHWHHNYWRLDFDIDGAANDVIKQNDVVQPVEFATLRCNAATTPACAEERNWQVVDTVTGRGFQLLPSADDYTTPTNQSGRNFHLKDVFGTAYNASEYSDRTTNGLSDCAMLDANLANSQDIDGGAGEGSDIVMYYRAGVRDRTNEGAGLQDSMICKRVGPIFTPIGAWFDPVEPLPEDVFMDGFEDATATAP